MANYTLTPNMSLLQPSIGVEGWQAAAGELNTSLSLVDGHDHSSGRGVAIGTAGINIQGDLALNGNNLASIRALRMSALSLGTLSASDNAALVVSGVDAYFRDGNGNNIRLTQSGSIVGTAGSISGLNSPASASYVSGSSTFIWQSAALTAANMDMASIILRNATASSNGITLQPPAALGANYTLTLPSANPGTNNALTLTSTAGNQSYLSLGSAYQIPQVNGAGTTLGYGLVGTNNIAAAAITNSLIAPAAVDTTQIVDNAVTATKLAASNTVSVNWVGTTITSATLLATTGNITFSGVRPVQITIQGATGSPAYFSAFSSDGRAEAVLYVTQNGSLDLQTYRTGCVFNSALATGVTSESPLGMSFTFFPNAGTYFYQVTLSIGPNSAGTKSASIVGGTIRVLEL